MTTIISALNQKGGAGKTTMAINLAACLIEQGRRVVVADADPQQSAARWARQGGRRDSAIHEPGGLS